MKIMAEDLAQILGTRETAALEFKVAGTDRDAIGQVVCAFANDLAGIGGGDLILGVRDNGVPVGTIDASDRELRALTEFRDDGRILDRPSMTVQACVYSNAPVIRIRVEASSTPIRARYWAHQVRIDTKR
jgi:ATP-dependent DNA helicase RecG